MELKAGYKQTEAGAIPAEWVVEPLINCCDYADYRGKTPPKTPSGTFLITARNVRKGYIDYEESKEYVATEQYEVIMRRGKPQLGDVLITTEAPLGNVAQIDREDVALAQRIIKYRPKNIALSSSYLKHYLLSNRFQGILDGHSSGSTAKGIKGSVLHQLPVVIPPPSEQRGIAEALSDADALIEFLERFIAKKRDLKQAAMQQLLTGQTRLPGFGGAKQRFRQADAGLTPEDWQLRPLLTTVRIAHGQVDPRIEPYKSMVLVAPDHIESQSGRLLEKKTASEQCAISGKYLFDAGDIIYSKIRPYLRKAILADFDGLCSADMYPLTSAQDVSPPFMHAVLLGHRFSCFAGSVSARSGMPKINREELAEYLVPLPSLPEQTAIAEVLSDMDAELAALEQRRDKTRALKQGMMQELLTGRTRLV
jgi:type I restriction enzyme S subunit